jgi:hypothetical protein
MTLWHGASIRLSVINAVFSPTQMTRSLHTDAQRINIAASTWDFPFKVQLNLKPFIQHWRKIADEDPFAVSPEVRARVEKELEEFPYLLEPTYEITAFNKHEEFLRLLFQAYVPNKGLTYTIIGVVAPFTPIPYVLATDAYKAIVNPVDGEFDMLDLVYSMSRADARILYAYKNILKKFYHFDLKVEYPIITSVTNHRNGTSRYYKLTGNIHFFDVEALAPLPVIDENTLQELLDRDFDADAWMKILPPENFVLSGLVMLSLVDVTVEHAITRLENHLLNTNTNDAEWVKRVGLEIQNLLRLDHVHLGMATMQKDGLLNLSSQNRLWNSLLPYDTWRDNPDWFDGPMHQEVMLSGRTMIIEDLRKQKEHPSAKVFIDTGFVNLLLTPIRFDDRIIGILELATKNPGELNGLALFKINQIRLQFGIAMKRLLEEFENKVEAVMMQQFTSIHPVVQWRFREAAVRKLENKANSIAEDIVFDNVYPFFGSLDIRDSSKKRSLAIERDLSYHLHTAHQVLQKAYGELSFDILGELIADVEHNISRLRDHFTTGEEITITEFIKDQVNPVIVHLSQQYPQLSHLTEPYLKQLGNGSQFSTPFRSGYEEALNLINSCIVETLDAEEADLQRLYPCYFEKYRTDGVEYNIYAGPSMARGRMFDPLYLDNMRLRQLLWTCDIVRKVEALHPQLIALDENIRMQLNGISVPVDADLKIEIAPLILGYSHPITLRFRPDEKRIEVDGTYNVRYAILKKRIDKATVLGKPERLTLPGHISIVYAQDQEAVIYERHLSYLLKKGMIHPEWEYLDLEPPQGVEGLRAIRAKVNLKF